MTDLKLLTAPLTLDRLTWRNFPIAATMAIKYFRWEGVTVVATYLWSLIRTANLRLVRPMVQRRLFEITRRDLLSARVETVDSLIHGKLARWVSVEFGNGSDVELLAFVIRYFGHNRLLVFRQMALCSELERRFGGVYHGVIPCAKGQQFYIYAVAPQSHELELQHEFSIKSINSASFQIDAKFFIVSDGKEYIGLTGYYSTGFWPNMIFGGWGTVRRRNAYRYTVLAVLQLTENLAISQNGSWFLVETTNAAVYRAARFCYELFGLQMILEIPNFYADGESYIIYGKSLG